MGVQKLQQKRVLYVFALVFKFKNRGWILNIHFLYCSGSIEGGGLAPSVSEFPPIPIQTFPLTRTLWQTWIQNDQIFGFKDSLLALPLFTHCPSPDTGQTKTKSPSSLPNRRLSHKAEPLVRGLQAHFGTSRGISSVSVPFGQNSDLWHGIRSYFWVLTPALGSRQKNGYFTIRLTVRDRP